MRCQNVNRHSRKQSTPKRVQTKIKQKHVYAVLHGEDDVSVERNEIILRKELSRPRPKVDVVKKLIERTLASRRQVVLDDDRPKELIERYPHLKKANYV